MLLNLMTYFDCEKDLSYLVSFLAHHSFAKYLNLETESK